MTALTRRRSTSACWVSILPTNAHRLTHTTHMHMLPGLGPRLSSFLKRGGSLNCGEKRNGVEIRASSAPAPALISQSEQGDSERRSIRSVGTGGFARQKPLPRSTPRCCPGRPPAGSAGQKASERRERNAALPGGGSGSASGTQLSHQ